MQYAEVVLRDVVKQVEANLGRQPVQVVADGGFTNQKNIVGLADAGVDFIGSLPDTEERKSSGPQGFGDHGGV